MISVEHEEYGHNVCESSTHRSGKNDSPGREKSLEHISYQ